MKLKKLLASSLACALVLAASGCGSSTTSGENTAPVISGVEDTAVEAGTEFDAFAAVSASDEEDGDLTSMITVTSTPSLDFVNGKVTVKKAGSYELTYSVTDDDGETVNAYATLTVTKQTADAVVYMDFDFSGEQEIDDHGWTANISDSADAAAELKQGAYVFDIASPGESDGDVQLVKSGLELKEAQYTIKVWAKSTEDTYCHIIARDESSEEWSTFGGAYNLEIGEQVSALEMNFTSSGEGSAQILINLGKITPNAENAEDTTPTDFTVTIDKIEIYEITGVQTQTLVYSCDFASSEETVTVEAGDGAEASVSVTDAAEVSITSYPTDGGVWSIKANIGIGDVQIEAGETYYYSFTVTSENNQSGECLVESAANYDSERANYASLNLTAGEETVISGTFVAENSVSDPVIRLQLGTASDGVTSNTITIDNVEFGTMDGNLQTVKTIDSFMAFGEGTVNEDNPELPWDTFNGTDEDNDLGVGTIYTENGSLFYRIDQGGYTDWYNKLICGYSDNPLTLEADSYYTIEITAKADQDVTCSFALNPIGDWDPRISESMNITTQEQTFTFTTTDTLIVDMNFEMLFQFGSEDTVNLGEVTIEFLDVTIYQMKVVD
ncbi:MAG: DUF5011 domain-containing protein [Lachnospiraceae bacterium]|nr:DUF5011 domain-containing protein [Lachnospiraceae bacterium]